jgi:uncharacterized protein
VASDCRSCEWKHLCRGGCRRDRETTHKELGRNYFCEAYAEFLPYAYPRLMDVARYVQKLHSQSRGALAGN